MKRKNNYIVYYDICDSKRLQKIYRHLSNIAFHFQYSVFHYEASTKEVKKLVKSLEKLIDAEADDLRIYQTVPMDKIKQLGLPNLPDGILLN